MRGGVVIASRKVYTTIYRFRGVDHIAHHLGSGETAASQKQAAEEDRPNCCRGGGRCGPVAKEHDQHIIVDCIAIAQNNADSSSYPVAKSGLNRSGLAIIVCLHFFLSLHGLGKENHA